MKKYLLAAAAVSAFLATPALADGNNMSTDTETYTINGVNPAKCNIVTNSRSFNLPNNRISDNNGFVRPELADSIANRLNNANLTAWCTGNGNSLVLSRSALTAGDGQVTNNFSSAAIYDLEVTVNDATRNGGAAVNEGSSDGPGNGPGIGAGNGQAVSRFGAQGAGSDLVFRQEPGSTVNAAGNATPGAEAPRSAYTNRDGYRLIAGTYTGTVTLTLTPGV